MWKVREHKKERTAKRVSFAVPIATELRASKIAIPDDSIMFIKGTFSVPPQCNEVDPVVTDCSMLIAACPVDSNTTQNDTKEKEGGQVIHSATIDSFDPVAVEGMQNNAFTKDFNIATPSEINNDVILNAEVVEDVEGVLMPNTTSVSLSTELEVDKTGEVLQADVGRHLGMVLGHLEDFLVSPSPMYESQVKHLNSVNNNVQLNLEQNHPPVLLDGSVNVQSPVIESGHVSIEEQQRATTVGILDDANLIDGPVEQEQLAGEVNEPSCTTVQQLAPIDAFS